MSDVPFPSPKEAVMLKIISNRRESFPAEIMRQAGDVLKLGSVYTMLERMRRKGLVSTRRASHRRLYFLTELGSAALSQWTVHQEVGIAAGHKGSPVAFYDYSLFDATDEKSRRAALECNCGAVFFGSSWARVGALFDQHQRSLTKRSR